MVVVSIPSCTNEVRSCTDDGDCPPGSDCILEDFCQPRGCDTNDDCPLDSYCNADGFECRNDGFCVSDDGCRDGFRCSPERSSEPPEGLCVGDEGCIDDDDCSVGFECNALRCGAPPGPCDVFDDQNVDFLMCSFDEQAGVCEFYVRFANEPAEESCGDHCENLGGTCIGSADEVSDTRDGRCQESGFTSDCAEEYTSAICTCVLPDA